MILVAKSANRVYTSMWQGKLIGLKAVHKRTPPRLGVLGSTSDFISHLLDVPLQTKILGHTVRHTYHC